MAVIFWYVSTTETSTALKKLEKAQQTTDTQTKEVKEIETIYHTTIKQNDTIIQQKVQEARDSVPDDTGSLIQLANSIIRSSNESGRVNSTDESVRPKDLDNRNTSE